VAGVAGLAASLFWVAMAYAVHLTFHLQPALVGAAAGWAYRRALRRRGGTGPVLVTVVLTSALVASGAGIIAAGHRGLDAPWLIALVAAAGLLLGLGILRRD